MGQSTKKSSSRKKRKLKKKISNLSKSLGLSPKRILLALVLLVGVGGLIVYMAFIRDDVTDAAGIVDESSPEAVAEKQRQIDGQLQAILKRPTNASDNFLLSINELQEAETEVLDIEAANTLTPKQVETIARIRMKTKSIKVLQMLKNNISCDAEKADLLRFCNAHKDSDDPEIRRESRYMLCSMPALDFSVDPSPETLQAYSDAIVKYEDCYLNSTIKSRSLALILKEMLNKAGDDSEIVKKGIQLFANQLQKSEIESIRSDGTDLTVIQNFGEFQLPTLAYRIAWKDPTAEADLDGAVTALSQNLNVGSSIWLMIIRAQESLLAINQIEEMGANWARLWTLSDEIPNDETKKAVQVRLQRQKHRVVSVGTQFDFAGTRLGDNKPIKIGDAKYVAIVFCDKGKESLELVKRIVKLDSSELLDFYTVIVFNGSFTKEEMQRLRHARNRISIGSVDTAKKFFGAMLVDIVPYVVLIDNSGKIVAANLQFEQIENRVQNLESVKLKTELMNQETIEK